MKECEDKVKSLKIVVVDDEKQILQLIKQALTIFFDADVAIFENVPSALEYIRANTDIDVVISDVNMPISGFELLEAVKEEFPETKVVMISGVHDNVYEAEKKGADAFLFKPFSSIRELEEVVKKLF